MSLPPIIEREMRVAVRAPGALKPRFWAAGAATVATAFFLLLSIMYGSSVWRAFHLPLFGAALYLAVVRPAQHAAGLFAEERRNQTLGLIYLTGISSLELFVTKFLGGLLVSSSELLALVPFLALPFLSGGISLELFLATAACLPTLLMFTISVTIMVSLVSTDESQALARIAGVIAVISSAMPLIYSLGKIVAGMPPFALAWLSLSPAYAPYSVFSNTAAGTAKLFWLSIAITWGWALLFIVMAAAMVPKFWRDDPDAGRWARLKARYSRNSARLRTVLTVNPFQWLVERNRAPADAASSACAGVIVLWLLAWVVWKQHWPSTANLYATALVLIVFVDVIQMTASAQHIASHRRDGSFEMLLTTPLQPQQIVDGQIRGLTSQFWPLRRTLCGLFVIMAASGLLTRPWNSRALISYFLIWAFLIVWASSSRRRSLPSIMWVALNTGRSTSALMHAHASRSFWIVTWIVIMSLYNFQHIFAWFGSAAATFPSGSNFELGLACMAVLFVFIMRTELAAKNQPPDLYPKLVSEMRAIVQAPVPSARDLRLSD